MLGDFVMNSDNLVKFLIKFPNTLYWNIQLLLLSFKQKQLSWKCSENHENVERRNVAKAFEVLPLLSMKKAA